MSKDLVISFFLLFVLIFAINLEVTDKNLLVSKCFLYIMLVFKEYFCQKLFIMITKDLFRINAICLLFLEFILFSNVINERVQYKKNMPGKLFWEETVNQENVDCLSYLNVHLVLVYNSYDHNCFSITPHYHEIIYNLNLAH